MLCRIWQLPESARTIRDKFQSLKLKKIFEDRMLAYILEQHREVAVHLQKRRILLRHSAKAQLLATSSPCTTRPSTFFLPQLIIFASSREKSSIQFNEGLGCKRSKRQAFSFSSSPNMVYMSAQCYSTATAKKHLETSPTSPDPHIASANPTAT